MDSIDALKDYLCERGFENAVIFVNPDFRNAFVGTTEEGRAVYDYDKMVNSIMEEDGMSDIDAIEFIEYNTIRALPYMGPMAPIIFYPIENET